MKFGGFEHGDLTKWFRTGPLSNIVVPFNHLDTKAYINSRNTKVTL